jgi:RNA polymerase subunit RPABC4/transcription elongation factor Spt4
MLEYITLLWEAFDPKILYLIWWGYILLLWLGIIIWIIRDASARWSGVFMQFFSSCLILFLTPIFWLPLYFLIRKKYVFWALEENFDTLICTSCDSFLDENYCYCPNCSTQIKKSCTQCKGILELHWKICPFCGQKGE